MIDDPGTYYVCTETSPRCYIIQKIYAEDADRVINDLLIEQQNNDYNDQQNGNGYSDNQFCHRGGGGIGAGSAINTNQLRQSNSNNLSEFTPPPPLPVLPWWFTPECERELEKGGNQPLIFRPGRTENERPIISKLPTSSVSAATKTENNQQSANKNGAKKPLNPAAKRFGPLEVHINTVEDEKGLDSTGRHPPITDSPMSKEPSSTDSFELKDHQLITIEEDSNDEITPTQKEFPKSSEFASTTGNSKDTKNGKTEPIIIAGLGHRQLKLSKSTDTQQHYKNLSINNENETKILSSSQGQIDTNTGIGKLVRPNTLNSSFGSFRPPVVPGRLSPLQQQNLSPYHKMPNLNQPIILPLTKEDTKIRLRAQLEYYFSRDNILHDRYLRAQMDNDQYVDVRVLADFPKVKQLTDNVDMILEALKESPNVQLDQKRRKVRPAMKRCTIILREIPESTDKKEIEDMFKPKDEKKCPKFHSVDYGLNNSWYVTFPNEQDTQKAFLYLHTEVKTFKGKQIFARIKTGTNAPTPTNNSRLSPRGSFKSTNGGKNTPVGAFNNIDYDLVTGFLSLESSGNSAIGPTGFAPTVSGSMTPLINPNMMSTNQSPGPPPIFMEYQLSTSPETALLAPILAPDANFNSMSAQGYEMAFDGYPIGIQPAVMYSPPTVTWQHSADNSQNIVENSTEIENTGFDLGQILNNAGFRPMGLFKPTTTVFHVPASGGSAAASGIQIPPGGGASGTSRATSITVTNAPGPPVPIAMSQHVNVSNRGGGGFRGTRGAVGSSRGGGGGGGGGRGMGAGPHRGGVGGGVGAMRNNSTTWNGPAGGAVNSIPSTYQYHQSPTDQYYWNGPHAVGEQPEDEFNTDFYPNKFHYHQRASTLESPMIEYLEYENSFNTTAARGPAQNFSGGYGGGGGGGVSSRGRGRGGFRGSTRGGRWRQQNLNSPGEFNSWSHSQQQQQQQQHSNSTTTNNNNNMSGFSSYRRYGANRGGISPNYRGSNPRLDYNRPYRGEPTKDLPHSIQHSYNAAYNNNNNFDFYSQQQQQQHFYYHENQNAYISSPPHNQESSYPSHHNFHHWNQQNSAKKPEFYKSSMPNRAQVSYHQPFHDVRYEQNRNFGNSMMEEENHQHQHQPPSSRKMEQNQGEEAERKSVEIAAMEEVAGDDDCFENEELPKEPPSAKSFDVSFPPLLSSNGEGQAKKSEQRSTPENTTITKVELESKPIDYDEDHEIVEHQEKEETVVEEQREVIGEERPSFSRVAAGAAHPSKSADQKWIVTTTTTKVIATTSRKKVEKKPNECSGSEEQMEKSISPEPTGSLSLSYTDSPRGTSNSTEGTTLTLSQQQQQPMSYAQMAKAGKRGSTGSYSSATIRLTSIDGGGGPSSTTTRSGPSNSPEIKPPIRSGSAAGNRKASRDEMESPPADPHPPPLPPSLVPTRVMGPSNNIEAPVSSHMEPVDDGSLSHTITRRH